MDEILTQKRSIYRYVRPNGTCTVLWNVIQNSTKEAVSQTQQTTLPNTKLQNANAQGKLI